MAERKTKLKLNDEEVDAWDVPIAESTERWTELRLEDGAVLRIKVVVGSVVRVDSIKDDAGNPLYVVKSGNALTLVTGPTKIADRKVQ